MTRPGFFWRDGGYKPREMPLSSGRRLRAAPKSATWTGPWSPRVRRTIRCSAFRGPARAATNIPPGASRSRNSRAGGSIEPMDDDLVEATAALMKVEGVHPKHGDVAESEGLDSGGGLQRQSLEPLQRHDFPRKLRQQRRAIARSRPNFANIFGSFEPERGDHRGQRRRRRRGLPAADRQRHVAPGDVGKALRHEQRAGRALERAQKLEVAHPSGPHGEGELGAFFGFGRAHGVPSLICSFNAARKPSRAAGGNRRR